MASCLQPRLRNSFVPHAEDCKDSIIAKSQIKSTKGEIEEQLDRCEQIYMSKIRKVFEEWKTFNLQNYHIIISKIDKSLVQEINKVICEQITIEKEQIIESINQMGHQILQKTQQKSNERAYQPQDHEKTRTFKKQKSYSLLKTRSISGENSRRKLSKGNFFADAKKINLNETTTHDYMVKTNPVSGFYHRNEKQGSKIKKNKKKDDNCFDLLQNTNSNTSPSNFMLNYINEKEDSNNSEVNKFSFNINFPMKKSAKVEQDTKKIQQPTLQIVNKTVLNTASQQNNMANQSKTYQILMANFEEKITKKLDTLVNKYTIIQEKLQKNLEKKQQKDQLKIIESSLQPPQINKASISIESSLVLSSNDLVNLPEASFVTLQQNSLNEQTLPQTSDISKVYKKRNQNQQTKLKQSAESHSKKAIKSIEVSNKIIKNKVKIVQNFQGSIQQIVLAQKEPTISENKQKIGQKENINLDKNISDKDKEIQENKKRIQSLLNDKTFFQRLILSFFAITQQTILPITKDLLYIVIVRYEQYCERNNLEKSYQIMSIERGKLQPATQYKKILEKMPKFVELKCDKNKKQKMLSYLEKFVEVICCYNQKENTISKQWKKLADSQLKEKAESLIDRIKV